MWTTARCSRSSSTPATTSWGSTSTTRWSKYASPRVSLSSKTTASIFSSRSNALLRGIFCAQVVEHLLTSEVERMMQLAYEKLLPSGVLVVETIDPRSLFALGNHFFADTSHVKPLHPETMRFICEQVGFSQVQLDERSAHPMMKVTDDLPDDDVGAAISELLKNVFGYQGTAIIATR